MSHIRAVADTSIPLYIYIYYFFKVTIMDDKKEKNYVRVYVRGNLEQPNISPLSLGPFASRGYHRSCWRNAVRSESINSKVSNVRPFRAPRNWRWKTGDDSSGGVGCFRGFRTSKRSHTSEHGFIEVYICPNPDGEYICGIPFWCQQVWQVWVAGRLEWHVQ